MEYPSLSDEIFKIDPNIRYAAILDAERGLLESRQRPGVPTMTDPKTDESWSDIVPLLVLGICERDDITKFLGEVRTITVRYDKLAATIFKLKKKIVVVTAKPEMLSQVLPKLESFLRSSWNKPRADPEAF